MSINRKYIICLVVSMVILAAGSIALSGEKRFVTIVLGTEGGLSEGNLSSYLIAPVGKYDFIALDAGTLLAGLQRAKKSGALDDIQPPADSPFTLEGHVLKNLIKAYLISHSHIDHLAGLIINAPDDSSKNILGTESTINNIRDHLFNWKVWPNFGDEGEGFRLKKYPYVRLKPGARHAVKGTQMTVTPFVLAHSGIDSTAFLIEAKGNYALYFGDTGPDEAEKGDNMLQVWKAVAPLIRDKKLAGIFLEVSYPDPRETRQLFGHLTPKWMMKELHILADIVNPQNSGKALNGIKIVVTHIKPSLKKGIRVRETIKQLLCDLNDLGLEFIFPEQGDRILF